MNEVEVYNITITEFDTQLGPKWNLTIHVIVYYIHTEFDTRPT